jgi:hypothetical protein
MIRIIQISYKTKSCFSYYNTDLIKYIRLTLCKMDSRFCIFMQVENEAMKMARLHTVNLGK